MTPINAQGDRWEVGSEFHYDDRILSETIDTSWMPPKAAFFASGRGALLGLAKTLAVSHEKPAIHLPSYFCPDVTAVLSTLFRINWYQDLPVEAEPRFDTLMPEPGDIVLAVNIFGVHSGRGWQEWSAENESVTLIEDHTHDPLSPWAQKSSADYCVSSLRKTLPLPDGAICWSPRHLPLPSPATDRSLGALEKLAAMILKRAYLHGAPVAKDAYRALQLDGEQQLGSDVNAAVSVFTASILKALPVGALRQQRLENIQSFVQLAATKPARHWEPLFATWPQGATPFNVVVVCASHAIREDLRGFLAERGVYCAVHWPQLGGPIPEDDRTVLDLSTRILTVPADHRYTAQDVRCVWDMMHVFEPAPDLRPEMAVDELQPRSQNG